MISISEGLTARQLDDELIILNTNNSCYYGLKNCGIDVYNYLEKHKSVEISELIKYLMEIYDIDKERINTDVNELINELQQEKLIEII